jgi:hypothetical protein
MQKEQNVLHTTDYSRFKFMLGNRKIDTNNLARLIQSFKKNYLYSPILVNQKMEIVDGQHRFMAAKTLQLPINYIVVKNYGIDEVQVLNTNGSNWLGKDFLSMYVERGYDSYIKLQKFMEDFPDFGIKSAIKIVTNGTDTDGKVHAIDDKRKDFQEGRLKIHNIRLAYENAGKIMEYKKYFNAYTHLRFVSTMIALFKIRNFDNNTLLHKISLSPTSLVACHNIEQYKELLEKIYNHHTRQKLNFRF